MEGKWEVPSYMKGNRETTNLSQIEIGPFFCDAMPSVNQVQASFQRAQVMVRGCKNATVPGVAAV